MPRTGRKRAHPTSNPSPIPKSTIDHVIALFPERALGDPIYIDAHIKLELLIALKSITSAAIERQEDGNGDITRAIDMIDSLSPQGTVPTTPGPNTYLEYELTHASGNSIPIPGNIAEGSLDNMMVWIDEMIETLEEICNVQNITNILCIAREVS